MIPIRTFQPEKGMLAGAFRTRSPLYKLIADLWLTDEWRVAQRALAVREVIVTDVSIWQDNNTTARKIDFVQMKAGGAQGVIIRAGQGNYRDEDFVDSWRAAKAAGLPRGAYFYYDPRVAPYVQADLFASLFANDPPELGVALDAEYPLSWGGAYAGWTYLRDFMERMKVKLPGTQKEIYTGYYWWFENVWMKTTSTQLAYFKQFPLHLAWYTNDPTYVKIPLPWTQAEFRWWQYTDQGNGALYGVESATVDLNNFVQGGVELFKKTYALQTPIPTPSPDGGTMPTTNYYEYMATGDRAIRTGPGATYPRIEAGGVNSTFRVGSKALGGATSADRVVLDGAAAIAVQGLVGDVWVKVYDNNGKPIVGWTAEIHKGALQVTKKLVEVLPPPTTEPSIFMTHTFTDDLTVTQPDGTLKAYNATFTINDVEYKPKP